MQAAAAGVPRAGEARRRNQEADKLIAAQRIENAVQWLDARLSNADLQQLGDMLSSIVVSRAEKTFRTAEFYDRIGRHKAAQFYYLQVVDNYATLSWA
ncbi:MAG: hypothetical protein ACK4MT_05785, partial [Thermaurantiacus tibetensis]